MATKKMEIGTAVSNDQIRLAVAYSEALDRCTRTCLLYTSDAADE